jgi:hypothetical protein
MKKLLTVIGVVLCAYLTLGFTFSPNNETTTVKNHQTLKWKHTTWVNPWAEVHYNFSVINDHNPMNLPTVCRLTHPGGTFNFLEEDYYSLEIPIGYPCTYECAIVSNPLYTMFSEIQDITTNTVLYSVVGETAYYQFTPIAGHDYRLFTGF